MRAFLPKQRVRAHKASDARSPAEAVGAFALDAPWLCVSGGRNIMGPLIVGNHALQMLFAADFMCPAGA